MTITINPRITGVAAGAAVLAATAWRFWPWVDEPDDVAEARQLMRESRYRDLTADEYRKVAAEFARNALATGVTRRGREISALNLRAGWLFLDLARSLEMALPAHRSPARPAVPRPETPA